MRQPPAPRQNHHFNASDNDRTVCAESPTLQEDPDGLLRGIIGTTMLHGPCGAANPDSPCMRSPGPDRPPVCSKRFPKPFAEVTIIPEDGYPLYRRRETGETIIRRCKGHDIELDNRFVVPYSPYLSRKYKPSHLYRSMTSFYRFSELPVFFNIFSSFFFLFFIAQ